MSDQVSRVQEPARPLLIRMNEAARLAAISRSSAYELSHGEWRAFTITLGKSRRVVYEGLIAWIRAQQELQRG